MYGEEVILTKVLNKINKLWILIGGGVLVLIAICVKNAVQSPYVLLHRTESLVLLPPLWILGFFWFGSFFILGGAMGEMLSRDHLPLDQSVRKYQGAMFLVLSISFSFTWYLLLFGPESLFLSWLVCGLAIIFGLIGSACWLPISKGCAALVAFVFVAYILLFILQFMVMLHI